MSKKTISNEFPKNVGFSYIEIANILSLMTKELHYIDWFSNYLPNQTDFQYIDSLRSGYTKLANLVPADQVDQFLEAFPYLHEAFGVPFVPGKDHELDV